VSNPLHDETVGVQEPLERTIRKEPNVIALRRKVPIERDKRDHDILGDTVVWGRESNVAAETKCFSRAFDQSARPK
jgi:hypothetical protein